MEKVKEAAGRQCPKCKAVAAQINAGYSSTGKQRRLCKVCNYKYSLNPKSNAYPQETRDLAIREYYSGVSARGVGKIHKMSHINVLTWIKKSRDGVDKRRNEI
jgi:transposase-like protein